MDFQSLAQTVGHEMVHKIAHDIYQEIVWNMIVYAAKVGIIAGLIMAVIGMALGMLKLSALDLTTYTGCMITSQPKGKAPFIAGFIFHIIMSAVFGIAYLYLLHTFNIPGTLPYAVGLGIAHTIFSGSFMLILDAINPCVANKSVPRVGFVASAQGLNATITYVIIHVSYAVLVIKMLTR